MTTPDALRFALELASDDDAIQHALLLGMVAASAVTNALDVADVVSRQPEEIRYRLADAPIARDAIASWNDAQLQRAAATLAVLLSRKAHRDMMQLQGDKWEQRAKALGHALNAAATDEDEARYLRERAPLAEVRARLYARGSHHDVPDTELGALLSELRASVAA